MSHSANTLGILLENKRLSLGFGIHDVAQALKIRPKYLIALERGDMAALPSPAYGMGYIRLYAQFLGLNGEAILHQLKEADASLQQGADLHIPEPYREDARPSGLMLFCAVVMLCMVYGGWYYIRHTEQSVISEISDISEELSRFSFLASFAPPTPLREEYQDYALTPRLQPAVPDKGLALYAKRAGWVAIYEKDGSFSEYYLREGEWFFPQISEGMAIAGDASQIRIGSKGK